MMMFSIFLRNVNKVNNVIFLVCVDISLNNYLFLDLFKIIGLNILIKNYFLKLIFLILSS